MSAWRHVCAGLLLVLAALAGRPAQAGDALGPAPETFVLANGLEVVVIPDHRAPVATHMVWYRVGAADEPPGKSGIAHFLEHLMFKGTARIAPGEFSKIVARQGGQDNAFTSQDYTAYFQRIAVDRLPIVMEMEADRMRNLALDDAVVATERAVILEERRSRTDNEPGSLLVEQMMAALYLSHPYGIPIIGWKHEMEGLTRADALDFYRRFYAPNNAILIVAGDVTAESVRPLAERFYGPIPAGDPVVRRRPGEPPAIAARRVSLADERVTLASFSRYYLAPSYATASGNEAHALDLLVDILGGSQTSRLYKALVVERRLATSAGAWYGTSALDDTQLGLFARPSEGTSLEVLEAAVDDAIGDLLANGVGAAELARAKTRLVSAAIYARDNQQTMARIYGVSLTSGETIEDIRTWPRRIEKIKARDVEAVARRYLDLRRSVTGHLLPAPAGEEAKP